MTGDRPLRILHVDDEKNQLDFTKLFLEQFEKDVKVDSVTDPEEALKLQEKEDYDCIVSDYKMLKMNGIELAQKVRENSDVPIILYTGQGSEEVAELAFSAGVDDYLRKETEPTHYQILAKRIKHTVEKHRAEELYKKVVEESRDAIMIIVENHIAFLNYAACRLFDYESAEDCFNKDVSEFFLEKKEQIFPLELAENGNYIIGLNYRTRKGVIKSAEVSISKTNYRGDEAYLCFVRDVTERKKNENRLNAIYQQAIRLGGISSVQDIIETTLDIIESVFEYQNISFHLVEGESLFLLGTRGEPKSESILPITSHKIASKAARERKSIIINDISKVGKFNHGNTKARSELAVPVMLSNKCIAILDIESTEKNSFTEEDRKVLETLAYIVAYSFNRIQTKKLIDKEESEGRERLNYALGVLDNAERANNLITGELTKNIWNIRNLVGILRIEPNLISKAVETIDENAEKAQRTSEILKETISQLQRIPGYIEINQEVLLSLGKNRFPRNIKLKTQYYEKLIIVKMEADLFSHMFNNILINAAEAMQNGGTLGIKITTRNKDVLIDVSNTGKAISRKELETSYKPLNDQQKDNHGVGITLCKKIAESAGGSLVLNYNENYGNILRLTLPIIEII